MSAFINQLQRQHLLSVTPYASARRSMSGGKVWLNANEAPATPSGVGAFNRYPAFQDGELLQAYAQYAGIDAEQVLAGRGSDEAIELLIRSFCEPGQDGILISTPTYGMYGISAQMHGASVVDVPLKAGELDVEGIVARVQSQQTPRIKVVFVCTPSNPLGNVISSAQVQALAERLADRALVVVDEAYIEYAQAEGRVDSCAELVASMPNLVVLRTLSKAFGLAALRCGFALADTAIIEVLRKVIAPYPLPQSTVDYARQALSAAGISAMQQSVRSQLALRETLMQDLQQRSWAGKIWPSATNFVLVELNQGALDATQLVQQCQSQGVLIRNQSAQPGLGQCVRISIGNAAEMQQLMEVLPA